MSVMSNLCQVITEMVYDGKSPEEIVDILEIDMELVIPLYHDIMFEESSIQEYVEEY